MIKEKGFLIGKVAELLRSGKFQTQAEMAAYLKVSTGAICKIMKKIRGGVVKDVALHSAPQVVQAHLDAVGQLAKINENANELLDAVMKWQRGDPEALQVLESQISTRRVKVGNRTETVKEFKIGDPRRLALKAMAEIRSQLALQLQLFTTLFDLQGIRAFQEEVLSEIGACAPEVRARIIERLVKRQALRGVTDIPERTNGNDRI